MSEANEQQSPTEGQETTQTSVVNQGTEPTTEPTTEGKQEKPAEPEFTPLTADDVKLPDGVEVNEGIRDEFLEVANEHQLPKEVVDKLVGLQLKAVEAASEKGEKLWQDTQEQWANEITNDPDLGGNKLETNLSSVSKLLDKYGSSELRQLMDLTGAGNNIHMMRFLVNVAKELTAEGQPVEGQGPTAPKDVAHILYPNQA